MHNTVNGVKFLTPEVQRLFVAALQGEPLRDLFYLQLETGLRPGEVVALQWGDVDFENNRLIVRHTARRTQGRNSVLMISEVKTKKEREVPLSNNAKAILQTLWSESENPWPDKLIFTNRREGLIEPNGLNRYLKRYREKMIAMAPNGMVIPVFTAHALRHTFATTMLEAKIPHKVVAMWLGHSSTRITDTYLHPSDDISQQFRYEVGNVIDFQDIL